MNNEKKIIKNFINTNLISNIFLHMCYNINSSKYCDNRRRKVKSKDGDRIVANFEKPRYSFIKLDEYGSCVWKQIDGKKTIYEIRKIEIKFIW